jgi:Ni/Co efflux regulator RcnB
MFFKGFLRLGAAALLLLAFSTTIAVAQDHDHEYDRHDRDDDHGHAYDHERYDHDRGWDHHYAEHDRDLHEWYRTNYRHLPPGLARRDLLPPALASQIVVRGFVPVELRARMQPCPHEVEGFLPPPPPGHVHVFIGGNLVLVNRANFQIVDVFHFNLN